MKKYNSNRERREAEARAEYRRKHPEKPPGSMKPLRPHKAHPHNPRFVAGSGVNVRDCEKGRSSGKYLERAVSHVHGKRIAIVGSSADWMLGRGAFEEHGDVGGEIDGHDTVIRFNWEVPDLLQRSRLGGAKDTSVLLGGKFFHELWLHAGCPDLWLTAWSDQMEKVWWWGEHYKGGCRCDGLWLWCIPAAWNLKRKIGLASSGVMAAELCAKGMGVGAYPSEVNLYGFDHFRSPGWAWSYPKGSVFSKSEPRIWRLCHWLNWEKHGTIRKADLGGSGSELDLMIEGMLEDGSFDRGQSSHYRGEIQRKFMIEELGYSPEDERGVMRWTKK
jgi:hypothetical protein